MRRPVLPLVVLLAALSPAAARAQTPVVPPAGAPPAPAPVAAQLTLKVERVGGLRATTLTGSAVVVRGTTSAYVAGQAVNVRFF